jgi:predicted RNA-binding Zn ribbon-like protein
MPERDDSFDWSGGHPALDFVNTLDERPSSEPVERLVTYDDLVRFADLAGLMDTAVSKRLRRRTGTVCTRTVEQARELREQLHEVLNASHRDRVIPRNILRAITAAIHQAHGVRMLITSGESHLMQYEWLGPPAADLPLHACALAIEDLLVRVDRQMIRKCGAFDCDIYFLDTSKGHRRQWCSMRNCGNREKQRRIRLKVGDQSRL